MTKRFPILSFPLFFLLFLLLLPARFSRAEETTCPESLVLMGLNDSRSIAALYEKPNQNSAVLAQIPAGSRYEVLEKSGSFYCAVYQGKTGYVLRSQTVLQGKASEVRLPSLGENDLSLKNYIPQKNLGKPLTLQGTIRSDLPIESLQVFLWDERSMRADTAFLIPFATPQKQIQCEPLQGKMPLYQVSAGRKMVVVQARAEGKSYAVYRTVFSIRGTVQEPAHITGKCEVSDANVLSGKLKTVWAPTADAPSLTVSIPPKSFPSLVTMSWITPPAGVAVALFGAEGELLSSQTLSTGFYVDHVQLPRETEKIVITPRGACSMYALRVYGPKYDTLSVQEWQPLPDRTDILFFSTHQDDEFLFFGGGIPYYSAQGRTVAVVYATDGGRSRYQESLDGLWAAGLKYHPVFLGWHNFRGATMQGALKDWNERNGDVQKDLVRTLRKYRPTVVVTQGFDGEYGHPQHMGTAYLMSQAVELAADPAYDPETAETPGVWQVQKMYVHGYQENALVMDWDQPLEAGGVISPMFLAKEAYDRHPSQHRGFSMEVTAKKYDCRVFGLYYTNVGPDTEKNDFFEHISD